ncbi:MAG: alpha/beta fold hydrolase [Rhodospirillales bacterium]|nr:alpha/beta fold hydrolase [Rhodospirillales bacterium]MDE2197630.1 alpha/beta fold hydrolase [Rhodospirillales bacterium]MDE2576520.1 alpha/beta fold hydrolase [Rhodospirillales bacterium]
MRKKGLVGEIGDLRLASGAVLPRAALAYETLGRLTPDGRNAVLLTHGYTSSHSMAGSSEGPWNALVGPGKPIDTERYFVVSSNMLGSAHGSTAPRSLNPATGRPYGPDFPAITVADIVAAQRALLERLGVRHLAAVAGPSYGGFQAFQWAVDFPDFVDAIVPAVSAPRRPDGHDMDALEARLARDPGWNGGHYYATGGVDATMTDIRVETLRRYGIEADLMARFPDPAARDAEIRRIAGGWARAFDANSLLVLGRALLDFDLTPRFPSIRARVLYALSRTDSVFPPTLAPGVMAALRAAGVRATYVEIDSELGHMASGADAAKWAPALAAFMAEAG